MKTRFLFAAAGMVCLAGAANAQAPTPTQDGQTRFGVGISLAPSALVLAGSNQQSSYLPIGLGDLFFPILIGRSFKLEAEAGILKASSETSSNGSTSTAKGTSLRLGVGAFKVMPLPGGATQMYIGPRVLLVSTSVSASYSSGGFSSDQSTDQTDWVIGLALGGEHFFTPHFSLGGELQVNYVTFGTPSHTPSSGSEPSVSQSLISTNGLPLLRAYF